MLRLSCLILFLFYDVTKGSDIEVEARVRMDPLFMKRMEQSLKMEKAILRTDDDLSKEIPGMERENENSILEQKIPDYSRNSHRKNVKSAKEMHEDRLVKKGIDSIESVAEYLRLKFNFTLDDSLVKESCELYTRKIKSYFNFMARKETHFDVEQEHIVFDKVEMAVTLQSSLERRLLNEVLANNSNVSKEDKYIMNEAIVVFTMRNKESEMRYVCRRMGLCRPFPGYSDHLAEILGEALKLFDVKFQYFVIKSAQLIVSEKSFLKTVLRGEIIEYLDDKAKNIVDANMDDIRERMSVLRSVITQRHRMVNVVDESVKNRTKAARIILDIIDTVFDKLGIEVIKKRADAVIGGIQDWAANILVDIEPVLNTFVTKSVAYMKYDLSPVATEEIKTLADIIYFGKPVGIRYVAEYLMTNGSKFANAIDFEKSDISDFRLKLHQKIHQLL